MLQARPRIKQNDPFIGFSIAQVTESTRFLAGEGKIGIMEQSKPAANNVAISCLVLIVTAGLVLSLVLIGVSAFVVLGG